MFSEEDQQKLLEMWEERQVEKLMYRYARSLDTGDWARLRTCFGGHVNLLHAEISGYPEVRISGDLQVELLEAMQGDIQRHHAYSNFTVDIDKDDPDKAFGFFYGTSQLHGSTSPANMGSPYYKEVQFYHVWFEREKDGWKIAKLSHKLQWIEGNYYLISQRHQNINHIWERVYCPETVKASEDYYAAQGK